MNILGIDPDTKTTGLGIVVDGRPRYGQLIAVPKRGAKWVTRRPLMVAALNEAISMLCYNTPDAEHIDIIVVEGQFIYTDGKARPNDILHLAQMAGAAMAAARAAYPTATLLVPLPVDWKGSVRKDIFTKALLQKLQLNPTSRGLEFSGSTARLPGTVKLPAKDATHVIDALGLARWAHMRQKR